MIYFAISLLYNRLVHTHMHHIVEIDGWHLYLSQIPLKWDASKLQSRQITRICSMLQPYELKFAYVPQSVERQNFLVTDCGLPTADQLIQASNYCLEGGNTLVHCKAGRGRSPIVVVMTIARAILEGKSTSLNITYSNDLGELVDAIYLALKEIRPQIEDSERYRQRVSDALAMESNYLSTCSKPVS